MGKSFTPKNIPKGAGQLNMGGPGPTARKISGGKMAGAKFTGGANSYKPSRMTSNKGR